MSRPRIVPREERRVARDMEWTVPWYSSFGNAFDHDYDAMELPGVSGGRPAAPLPRRK
jgi:predicted dithiol-disulfide oxidoreductase (DUF899 family)